MEVIVDSKNRITIPRDVRDKLGIKHGTILEIQESKGKLIIRKKKDATAELEKINNILKTPPRRTGKPENWPPNKMKAIWTG